MKLILPTATRCITSPFSWLLALLLPLLFWYLPFHFLLLLSAPAVSSSPCHFPAIFNLGDSNSDTGGLSAAFSPLPPPYGETFFKMPVGRYSDGRLVIDFIAESFGLPYLSAYLDSLGTNFSHGANYATSASTILKTHTSDFVSPFSLDVQLGQFLQFKFRSKMFYKQGGVFKDSMPKEAYFSQALYTLDIGQNDLTAFYFSNISAEEFLPKAMQQFSSVIKNIYEEGGRSFWIHNTGPLGCLPYVLLRVPLTAAQLDSAGCGILYNELSQQFNKKLNETVTQLRKDLPLAAITLVDVYSVKYSLISQATEYGFEHPLGACCGHGGGEYNFDFKMTCFSTALRNGKRVSLGESCKDPLKRINWDGYHYTEAANKWLFDRISGGKYSDPPVPLSMACLKEAP